MNKERMVAEFIELSLIDSISFQEREICDLLTKKLKELGFKVEEDHAGKFYNGNAGNLYGILKGTKEGSVLFSSHMDTVEPGFNKSPRIKGKRIEASGGSILGADDISGLVEILEGIRYIEENHIEHKDIEIIFPIAEEVYTKGSKVFDYSKVKSKEAYILDLSGPIGKGAYLAPSLIKFSAVIHGKAAHSGANPELGINAIEIAGKFISAIQQGHVDEVSTINIGSIRGGEMTNIVCDHVLMQGEIRSHDHQKALEHNARLEKTLDEICWSYGAHNDYVSQIELVAYENDMNSKCVQDFITSCKELNIEPTFMKTFGGSDANSFMEHGIESLVISSGMYETHSTKEYTIIDDLIDGANLVAKLIQK